jgi:O-antigen/teichoic acid export membrane protein
LIKGANGLLAYIMLLVIARSTSSEQYGVFAVAFSVSVATATLACLGQTASVTRYWPQWMGQNKTEKANAVLGLSFYVTAAGLILAALLMTLGGSVTFIIAVPWSFILVSASAFFTFAFGLAEYTSFALRAQGQVVMAMAPRDIFWRVVIIFLFWIAAVYRLSLGAEVIILILSTTLLVVTFPQILMLLRSASRTWKSHLSQAERKQVAKYSLHMWAINSIQMGRSHAGVVIVSAFLGAEAAGAYFAADRTANILALILLAVNLVSAPLISRYYHSGQKDLVRLIVGLSGLAGATAAFAGLGLFFIFGAEILSLFDPAYGDYITVLLILCIGQFVAAATGPVGALLTLSGHERVSLNLTFFVSVVGLLLQVAGGYYWGAVGVALAHAAGAIFGNMFATVYAWWELRIDTTGLSLLASFGRKLVVSTNR